MWSMHPNCMHRNKVILIKSYDWWGSLQLHTRVYLILIKIIIFGQWKWAICLVLYLPFSLEVLRPPQKRVRKNNTSITLEEHCFLAPIVSTDVSRYSDHLDWTEVFLLTTSIWLNMPQRVENYAERVALLPENHCKIVSS